MHLSNRALAAFVLCAVLVTPSFSTAAADNVKIGVLTDMAGVTADATGKGSVEAARLAVEEAGGKVLGQPIEIVVGDHQHRPDIGSSMARRWFDVDKVSVIVDVPDSAVALAVQGIAKEKKKLVLFSSPGTTALTQEQCSPYECRCRGWHDG